jgi:hypothetical protein
MPQFALLTMLVIMPLEMLSGGMTPRESMPQIVQDVMLVAPTTHFVLLAQAGCFVAPYSRWCGRNSLRSSSSGVSCLLSRFFSFANPLAERTEIRPP